MKILFSFELKSANLLVLTTQVLAMPTSVFRFNKCGDRFLIVFGMFIVGVTMFSILSGTLGKVYDIRACCDLLATFLEKSLFEVCVLTEIDEIHETRCVKLNGEKMGLFP